MNSNSPMARRSSRYGRQICSRLTRRSRTSLTQEAKLEAEYNELPPRSWRSPMAVDARRWERFHEDADRQVREGSQRVKWELVRGRRRDA
ncbi:MAG: hypothetical protein R3F11_15605 [Verrucomicrobiales bacterium]